MIWPSYSLPMSFVNMVCQNVLLATVILALHLAFGLSYLTRWDVDRLLVLRIIRKPMVNLNGSIVVLNRSYVVMCQLRRLIGTISYLSVSLRSTLLGVLLLVSRLLLWSLVGNLHCLWNMMCGLLLMVRSNLLLTGLSV